MPDHAKKKHDKKKGDPKDQRKPRQRHQQSGAEKKTEEPKNAPNVTAPQKRTPSPDIDEILKKETDLVLKIGELDNDKYKKKEIQSNWSKYEVPIDTYEEIEEHENLGADYEKLTQAAPSVGGHFQFKHEKSWDLDPKPTLYDEYFKINMEELNMALCSIPFYERNSIEEATFSETDILSMNNRSTRFKEKYYNDKSYSTPETEAHDKILNNLKESVKEDLKKGKDTSHDINIDKEHKTSETVYTPSINLEYIPEINTAPCEVAKENVPKAAKVSEKKPIHNGNKEKIVDDFDFIFGITNKFPEQADFARQVYTSLKSGVGAEARCGKRAEKAPKVDPTPTVPEVSDTPAERKKIPVTKVPDDLDKWLDDYLNSI